MTSNFFNATVINFIIMIAWHQIIFILCKVLPNSFFDYHKPMYRLRPWENNGLFYVKFLKIKKWKDRLPQYISKNGFSKKHMISYQKMDLKYINQFITETCRAEWNHIMCCMYFIVSFLINSLKSAIIFSVIPIIVNLPFCIIQRYNRIRLIKLNSRYNHDTIKI